MYSPITKCKICLKEINRETSKVGFGHVFDFPENCEIGEEFYCDSCGPKKEKDYRKLSRRDKIIERMILGAQCRELVAYYEDTEKGEKTRDYDLPAYYEKGLHEKYPPPVIRPKSEQRISGGIIAMVVELLITLIIFVLLFRKNKKNKINNKK